MKIIGKHKDYYDNALGFDSDDSLTYIRHTKELDYQKDVYGFGKLLAKMPNFEDRFHKHLILFCGKIYPVWEIRNHFSDAIYCPTVKDIEATIADLAKYGYSYLSGRWSQKDLTKFREQRQVFEDYVSKYTGSPIDVTCFRDLDCPYFLVSNKRWWAHSVGNLVVNPKLQDYNFAKLVDPTTCHQEVEMFLGSALAKPDIAPQRVGSDEILILQKGFDNMSFRTVPPGGKRLRRAENRARKRGIR